MWAICPSQPTAKAFDDCCNEFWWLNPYVAKGLWRDELIHAKYMLDTHMREQLLKMLTLVLRHADGLSKIARQAGQIPERPDRR